MSGKWQTQMTMWCSAVMIFGLVLIGGAFEATSGGVQAVFALLDGPGPITYDPVLRFSLALMGAVTLGWGATVLAVVHVSGDLPDSAARALWLGITAAIV